MTNARIPNARVRLILASMLTGIIGGGAGAGAAAGANRYTEGITDLRRVVAASGEQSALNGLADLRQEVVLSGAGVNGHRLDLNRFVDARSAEALREEVRGIWMRRAAPIHGSTRDGWLVLTQVVGSSVEMLELRPLGSLTEGRWSRLRKGEAGLAQASAWLEAALPAGSDVLDRMDHDDDGHRMTTIVATTSAAVNESSELLLAKLKRRGFSIESRSTPSFAGEGLAFFLRRGAEDVAVAISEHEGRCAMVLHWGRRAP